MGGAAVTGVSVQDSENARLLGRSGDFIMQESSMERMPDGGRPLSETARGTALVAKQPIFDLKGHIWGYELLFRSPDFKPGGRTQSPNEATSTVMIDGFEMMRPTLRGNQRFFINYTAEFLEAGLPSVLPPDTCIIEILEDTEPTGNVLNGLMNLKDQGYKLALDDYVGQETLKPFLPLVDIVKVDVLGLAPERIAGLSESLSGFKALLLAEKVEDRSTADFCRKHGFSLFQGHFYCKAELVSGKKLNPSQITRVRLLRLTADKELSMHQAVEAISSDVYLTYRLLRFINSVYFGLPMKVFTVPHAARLLGVQKLRQWLFVTALAGVDSSAMSQEIVYISAFRAKFLELLAENSRGSGHSPLAAKLFMAGLFSLLESLMRMPFDEIFASIAIDPDVLQVLSEGEGPLAPWYHLMGAYEHGRWENVRKYSDRLGLSDDEMASAYAAAGRWSTAIFQKDSEYAL